MTYTSKDWFCRGAVSGHSTRFTTSCSWTSWKRYCWANECYKFEMELQFVSQGSLRTPPDVGWTCEPLYQPAWHSFIQLIQYLWNERERQETCMTYYKGMRHNYCCVFFTISLCAASSSWRSFAFAAIYIHKFVNAWSPWLGHNFHILFPWVSQAAPFHVGVYIDLVTS